MYYQIAGHTEHHAHIDSAPIEEHTEEDPDHESDGVGGGFHSEMLNYTL